jgi:excisionase family DNA binding protein
LKNKQLQQDQLFITIKQAAEILHVNKDTLRRWDKTNKLKTKRHPINNYRIYNAEEIEKLKKAIIGK